MDDQPKLSPHHPLPKRTQIPAVYWMLISLGVIGIGLIGMLFIPTPVSRPQSVGLAPFTAPLGATHFSVPDRDDLYQARLTDLSAGPTVTIRVCWRYEDVPKGCRAMSSPTVNSNGVSTFMWHEKRATYRLLSERPTAEPPGRGALLTISADQIDTDLGGDGEAYQLKRISLLERPLQTTDRRWPVASCGVSFINSDVHQCGIGFLVNDVFVVASWTAEPGVVLTQADVWAVATELDAKIRGLIAAPDTLASLAVAEQPRH